MRYTETVASMVSNRGVIVIVPYTWTLPPVTRTTAVFAALQSRMVTCSVRMSNVPSPTSIDPQTRRSP